jgi:hypothetical protein
LGSGEGVKGRKGEWEKRRMGERIKIKDKSKKKKGRNLWNKFPL